MNSGALIGAIGMIIGTVGTVVAFYNKGRLEGEVASWKETARLLQEENRANSAYLRGLLTAAQNKEKT